MAAVSSCKRIMRFTYFRCCYSSLLGRKLTLLLFLATAAGLFILLMTSQPMTQTPAQHGGGWSSLWTSKGSPEHHSVIPEWPLDSSQPKEGEVKYNATQIQDIVVKANQKPRQLSAAKTVIPSKDSLLSDPVKGKEGLGMVVSTAQNESHHVFFLKVHKAGSTTVMNVLYRFAAKRHLNVMLPQTGNLLSETSASWTRRAMSLPQGATHFDILCNHLVYNESAIRSALPEDAKFIGIVREPFQQFVSAFFYYRIRYHVKNLQNIPGDDPLNTYLQNPKKYEFGGKSYTHNRMSFDFGMSRAVMKNEESIREYIAYLNKTFDLVMIQERFDESMVLMKRLLGWQLRDVLYTKNNVFSKKPNNFTEEQKHSHRNFNIADYKLYEHFEKLFQTKVENEGALFQQEVSTFVRLRETVEQFCHGRGAGWTLAVPGTEWSSEFQVNRTDCRLMGAEEPWFVKRMRLLQYRGTPIV